MLIRRHNKGNCRSEASYSDCEGYRFALTRVWDAKGPKVTFVMLNPSTATEVQNDPTVERCERRARTLGYGAFQVTNIFAFRATDPRVMKTQIDPVGADNNAMILAAAAWADLVVCAWGSHGAHLGRGQEVGDMLRQTNQPLHHLGLTKEGHPKHPLYIGYAEQPRLWA